MRIPELGNENLEDEADWSDALSEVLTEYCEGLEKQEGMILTLEEAAKLERNYEEHWAYVWTDKAQKLIEQEIQRLQDIAHKYCPDNFDVGIQSYMYKKE